MLQFRALQHLLPAAKADNRCVRSHTSPACLLQGSAAELSLQDTCSTKLMGINPTETREDLRTTLVTTLQLTPISALSTSPTS